MLLGVLDVRRKAKGYISASNLNELKKGTQKTGNCGMEEEDSARSPEVRSSTRNLTNATRNSLKGNVSLRCGTCSRRFPSAIRLQRHLKIVHKRAGKVFWCSKCQLAFYDISRFLQHSRSHQIARGTVITEDANENGGNEEQDVHLESNLNVTGNDSEFFEAQNDSVEDGEVLGEHNNDFPAPEEMITQNGVDNYPQDVKQEFVMENHEEVNEDAHGSGILIASKPVTGMTLQAEEMQGEMIPSEENASSKDVNESSTSSSGSPMSRMSNLQPTMATVGYSTNNATTVFHSNQSTRPAAPPVLVSSGMVVHNDNVPVPGSQEPLLPPPEAVQRAQMLARRGATYPGRYPKMPRRVKQTPPPQPHSVPQAISVPQNMPQSMPQIHSAFSTAPIPSHPVPMPPTSGPSGKNEIDIDISSGISTIHLHTNANNTAVDMQGRIERSEILMYLRTVNNKMDAIIRHFNVPYSEAGMNVLHMPMSEASPQKDSKQWVTVPTMAVPGSGPQPGPVAFHPIPIAFPVSRPPDGLPNGPPVPAPDTSPLSSVSGPDETPPPMQEIEHTFIIPEELSEKLFTRSLNRGNFAKQLAFAVFSPEERRGRNCFGRRAGAQCGPKAPLDPIRLYGIRRAVFSKYPPEGEDEETVWRRECVVAIDTALRGETRSTKKQMQMMIYGTMQ